MARCSRSWCLPATDREWRSWWPSRLRGRAQHQCQWHTVMPLPPPPPPRAATIEPRDWERARDSLLELTSMGFTEDQATIAFQKAGGDVGRAVHLLLDQPEIAASSSAPPPPRTESVTAGLPVPAPRFEYMYESAGMAISTPYADEGELTAATLKQMGFEATAVAAAMQQSGGDATRALERLLAVDEAEQSLTTRGPSGDACASTSAHASDVQIAAGGVVQQEATARNPEIAQSAKISQRIGRARAALDKNAARNSASPSTVLSRWRLWNGLHSSP